MWVAHNTALSHWSCRDKQCLLPLLAFNNVRETSGWKQHSSSKKSGKFLMASVVVRNSSNCNIMFHRGSRIACQQRYIILGKTTAIRDMAWHSRANVTSSLRRLSLRTRLRQGGDRGYTMDRVHEQSGQLKACLASSEKDSTESAMASEDDGPQEVPAGSLEFTHKVALDVLAPPDLVWQLWTDIKSAPMWMRWIDRVEFLDEDASTDGIQELPPGLSQLSRWICSTIGFEVMWVARVEYVESALPVRVLRWATVEGLSSRGQVTFKENSTNGTTVELSISHSLPAALGQLMQSNALRGLVQATLQSDLECFQKYAAKAVNQQLDAEVDGPVEQKGSLTITTDMQSLDDAI